MPKSGEGGRAGEIISNIADSLSRELIDPDIAEQSLTRSGGVFRYSNSPPRGRRPMEEAPRRGALFGGSPEPATPSVPAEVRVSFADPVETPIGHPPRDRAQSQDRQSCAESAPARIRAPPAASGRFYTVRSASTGDPELAPPRLSRAARRRQRISQTSQSTSIPVTFRSPDNSSDHTSAPREAPPLLTLGDSGTQPPAGTITSSQSTSDILAALQEEVRKLSLLSLASLQSQSIASGAPTTDGSVSNVGSQPALALPGPLEPAASDPDPPSSSSSGSKTSPPPSPPASDLADSESRLDVIVWTLEGDTLWLTRSGIITTSPGSTSPSKYRLPTSSSPGKEDNVLERVWATLSHIGLDIRDLAAQGPVRTPLRLEGLDQGEAFALCVKKDQAESARRTAESRVGPRHRRYHAYVWANIPPTTLESEMEEYEEFGRMVWAALSGSEEYIFRSLSKEQAPASARKDSEPASKPSQEVRAPPDAPTAPVRPTVTAWARPAGGVPPAANPNVPTGHGSPSLQHAAVDDDDPAAFPFRPLIDRAEPEPMPDTSVDTAWPALRTVPWVPPFQGSSTASWSAAKQD
ncbi:hypothetical protein CYMTET_12294 [Cymbomonas tetramitiformis]|uniref:Uncharacterized protein n=1 Tax=Cymbomonas tetramitiformis TaxID=36881 RepID=A0AAE0LCA7_9CHLO|nr:hypothetical protein CYMTET_12294 [Cymbomonas tetramitiformis]